MFEVHAFSEDVLYKVAAHEPRREGAEGRSAEQASQNRRLSYLHAYLKEIGCASILVERDYVDRDFLMEDIRPTIEEGLARLPLEPDEVRRVFLNAQPTEKGYEHPD